MKENSKTQKISRMILKTLSQIFQQNLVDITKPAIVTIIDVKTSSDLSIANIYLSILYKDKQSILDKIIENSKLIRKHLGNNLANKIRKIPSLRFYIDDSLDYSCRINKLIKDIEEN
ncbi:MAG: 30S ribosome-binding factor RbfA [Bacteroidetes bacterium]|nr:30S ribosome-binding factor RbfA [Bacteroidota bacterium]